jgi:hypothetical protein
MTGFARFAVLHENKWSLGVFIKSNNLQREFRFVWECRAVISFCQAEALQSFGRIPEIKIAGAHVQETLGFSGVVNFELNSLFELLDRVVESEVKVGLFPSLKIIGGQLSFLGV